MTTGTRQRQLSGHKKCICNLAFSRDGRTLATASDDGVVKLWRVR